LKRFELVAIAGVLMGLMAIGVDDALGLPPPEDVPEEVLRTQIITEARSPIDGKPLTAAEYAELQAALRIQPPNPLISAKQQELIFLLRVRQLLRSLGLPTPK
jgi:hypothetical protein